MKAWKVSVIQQETNIVATWGFSQILVAKSFWDISLACLPWAISFPTFISTCDISLFKAIVLIFRYGIDTIVLTNLRSTKIAPDCLLYESEKTSPSYDWAPQSLDPALPCLSSFLSEIMCYTHSCHKRTVHQILPECYCSIFYFFVLLLFYPFVTKEPVQVYLGVSPCPILCLSGHSHPLPAGQVHLRIEFL